MTKKNPHIGSSFESWLNEVEIGEDVTAAAIKVVIARRRVDQSKEKEAGEESDPSSRRGLAKRGPRRMNGPRRPPISGLPEIVFQASKSAEADLLWLSLRARTSG